jgi:hypothetical protein
MGLALSLRIRKNISLRKKVEAKNPVPKTFGHLRAEGANGATGYLEINDL